MKKKAWNDCDKSDFTKIGTLQAASPKLIATTAGEIIEDPPLLSEFCVLCAAMSDELGCSIRLGDIRVTETRYLAAIYGAGDLYGQSEAEAKIIELLRNLNDDNVKLDSNCQRETPVTAAECGVNAGSMGILRTASRLDNSDSHVELTISDQAPVRLPAPDERALLALPQVQRHPDRKVDGPITGIGRGDTRGTRVEIGRRSMYLVPDLELDEAIDLLRRQARIAAIAKWEQGGYVLQNVKYPSSLFDE